MYLIVVLSFLMVVFSGGSYYGHRRGYYGARMAYGGIGAGWLVLLALLLLMPHAGNMWR